MRRTALTLSVIGVLGSGCTLSRIHQTDCANDAQCRDLFGFGHYCGDDGFCAEIDPIDRCSFYPENASFPLDPAETVLYASLFNHTSDTHMARVRSTRLAVTQANQNGGLDGRDFVILECTIEEDSALDDLDQQAAAVEVATALSEQVGVPAIVGPASSSDVEAVFNAIGDARQTLVISPSATSPSLIDLDGLVASDAEPGLLWRTAPPDSFQARAIAADMTTRGVASVAVVYQNGAYGDALAELFASDFGGTVSLFPFGDATARDNATAAAGDAGVDEVLFISSEVNDVVAFLNGAVLITAYETLGIFLTDTAATVQVLEDASAASDLFDQVRGTTPAVPSGNLYDTFVVSYGASYGGEDVSAYSYTAHSYDASWLVIYGAAWAASQGELTSAEDFARGLRQISDKTVPTQTQIRATSWNSLKASFEAGRAIDVLGTSGELDYDSDAEETSSPIEVWVIDPAGPEIVVEYVSEEA